ncbi:MAG TPA: phage major capsid protein [Noviherbaspirillum sp.]|nr:phage major capsid protein [Noviherbaspirillum sp.]
MIHNIKEQRALAVAEMRSMVEKAQAEKRNLSADEAAKFDTLKAKVTDLESQEQRAAFLADAERRMLGTPVTGDKSFADLEKSVSLMEVLQAGMEGRSLTGAAAEYSKEAERRTGRKAEGVFIPMAAIEKRVNTTSSAAELVPTIHRADQYIEPFRNELLARRLGVRVLSGLTGNVTIPKHGSGVSVGWVAENGNLSDTNMTFDNVTLSPKHAGGITELSRQLIQQSSPDAERLVADDLRFMLAQAIDTALIKGGGTNEPVGVLSTTGIQTASLATLNWLNTLTMKEKLELVNATAANWLMSKKVATKFAATEKSTGTGVYLMSGGQIADLPAYSTNQVPNVDADSGVAILGDWSQVLLGIWSEIDILVNPYDSAAYARGGVKVRAMSTVDIAVRHPEAFVVANDVAI